MCSMTVFSYAILILASIELKIEAKTYYFNLNKTTNEYTIRNRINPDNSAYSTQYPYLSELRNNVTRTKNTSETHHHPFLDPEWDYNWKNITRRKLPTYIYKFYETFSKEIKSTIRILFNANPQNSTIIRFNLSDLNFGENVSEVELHFYHKVDEKLHQKQLIIRLYQMENSYINETSLINPDSHKLLNVIYIYQAETGWQVFKLTNALQQWIDEKKDLSLFITISKPNEEQFSFYKDTNREAFRTFVILKSEPIERGSFQEEESKVDNNPCQKRDLYIDFEKLNWIKFIISPPGYHAYKCHGACFRNGNYLNHWKAANSIPQIARKPLCCVPTDYTPLSIMFYDKSGNVAIKVYNDMIISACGCR